MYRLVAQALQCVPDAAAFLESLAGMASHVRPELRELFDRNAEIIVSRAPGRLDVMGGIADYCGSQVLEMPIREATFAALQRDRSRRLRIVSLSDAPEHEPLFEMSLDSFYDRGRTLDYQVARSLFKRGTARHWAAYVAGVFLVLMRETGILFEDGARILIESRVPEGVGVSSSAALEVSVMQAVAAAYDIALKPRELAILCQMVENHVAGAPCGVMDQMTAMCGEETSLLSLLCQPAEIMDSIRIPEEITFYGLDSGIRHSVGGEAYGDVRAGAFIGYRMIAERAGLAVTSCAPGTVHIRDSRWCGYLANMTPVEFEKDWAAHLPDRIDGAEFLSRYQGTTDTVSVIHPERSYAVRVSTAHPIYENSRVRRFAELLGEPLDEGRLEQLGELMYQSHSSYSACGLGSSGTDLLVRLVREAGPSKGLFGARITGGGSGGTVAVLSRRGVDEAVQLVASRYEKETGHRPHVFSGSSPGSAAFGAVRLNVA